MARQQGWFAFLVALVISAFLLCINLPFQLGLDLRGGSQVTFQNTPPSIVNGIKIKVVKTTYDGIGVDTEEDLEKLIQLLKSRIN